MSIQSVLQRFKPSTPTLRARRHRQRSLRRLIVEHEDRRLMAVIDLATLTAAQGTTIFGADSGDQSGISVSSAGDVNGDGFDDLLIGAYTADASGNAKLNAGDSYVIFGGNGFTSSVTHLGTTAAETLTGTAGANVMVGGRGNDTLIGSGGTQVANQTIGPNTFTVYTQGQATLKVQVAGSASVANRQVFYNRSTSTVFGIGSGNPSNSIDSTKTALLPGQTTSFANYTNYSRGLNGLIVDVGNLGGLPTAADFQFATWDGINLTGFTATAAVPTVSVIPDGGLSNSTRVKIEFADDAVRNTWLRVTLLANANTGLAANDVFYFGNAVGDMNAGNIGLPITVRSNASDTSAVRQNQSPGLNSVGITNIFDLNKDGRVNATDTSAVRQNQLSSIIRFFTAPASLQMATSSLTVDSIMADSSWLDDLSRKSIKRRMLERRGIE